ncbi:hypothetical protein [Candidatus Magnetobacterium casense]|uniref:Uncharacterized protein n=1 Tax=Candidatus Magnetobacterium casense TaxID=1455061 RepID=A0ABS6RYB3_9BACT|nr:hypothetical protein [Candidatus Magnetobacterium casensis]MBV6341630.1 hypothetical protein [Candidatus Magnetobacterium casensis]
MNLLENPFYILELDTCASRHKIVEVCDEKSLTLDSDTCTRFCAMLTHPRNRIHAEISWLPGVASDLVPVILYNVKRNTNETTNFLSRFNPLVRCNAVSTFFSYHKPNDPSQIVNLILVMAKSYDEIKTESLMATLNKDRHLAGFPQIQDVDIIFDAIEHHRRYLATVMISALNNIKDPDIVFTEIVEVVTSHGQQQPPKLITDLAELYQREVQRYLNKLSEQILAITKDLQSRNMQERDRIIKTLENRLMSWYQIVRPIHIIMKTQGIEDSYSLDLARELRNASIFLANEMGMYGEAKRISMLISKVFKELPMFAEFISSDVKTLEDIIVHKKKSAEEKIKWQKEISLDIEIGTLFKDRLVISSNSITYKERTIKTDEISRIRWGILVEYNDGQKSKSYYTIWIGTPRELLEIECNTMLERLSTVEKRYALIIEKLWKAVCIRLFSETLSRLSLGEKIVYGDNYAVVDKNGILLAGNTSHYRWEDITFYSSSGGLVIKYEKNAQTRLSVRDVSYSIPGYYPLGYHLPMPLSYRNHDNIHILETLLRFLHEDGNYHKLRRGEFK